MRGLLQPLDYIGFAIFQLGIGVTIQLGLFPWISVIALLPFVLTGSWDRIERVVATRMRTWATRTPTYRAWQGGNRLRPTIDGRTGTGLAAAALVLTVGLNLDSFRPHALVPTPVAYASELLGLSQGWRMYDSPGSTNLRLQVHGTFADGTSTVLDDGGRTTSWDDMARLRSSYRAKNYLEWVADPDTETAQPILADWVCRRWNGARTGTPHLTAVELMVIDTPIGLVDQTRPSSTSVQGRWLCDR